ncbi:MAG: PilN domain-containing protein [Fimbriimonadaceae bacterium]|nr:PilN domain-containing protein [Fimbriimonadaceae bacterium]
MPLINLIQEQRLARRRNEGKARTFFFVFVGSAVASLGGFGYFFLQSEGLAREKTQLEAQIAKSAPLVKQIEEYQAQYGQLAPRLKTLEDAQLVSNRWGRILTHIATQTPSPTWLTALRVQGSDAAKPINLSVQGVSPNQEPISEFILRLQNSKDLENVGLKYSQEKMMQRTKAVEFEVTADIVGTAEAKPKEEKEGESK